MIKASDDNYSEIALISCLELSTAILHSDWLADV